MATIKQIKDTEGNVHDILSTIGYGTCDTASETAAKVATIDDTSWTLKVGSIIGIKFTNTNTAGSTTTPVTLNVNNTGAKYIWYNSTRYTSTSYNICGFANRVIYYMYDGIYWVWMNSGALDSGIVPSIQIETSAIAASKVGACTNYTLLANSYAHANVRYANTRQSALTLNVNSTGAKRIYINGTASSASNYTLPAGTYIIYYDGTNYHFRTDGVLPGKILNAINDANGNNISSTYARLSDFDSFTSHAEQTYTKISYAEETYAKIGHEHPNPMLSVNYLELVNLRDNGQLIPGQQYRIIDYVTTTSQEDTESAGHQFDIIVTAISNNTLSEIASACLHEGDIYFSGNNANLSAWQIWYSLDNDNSRFEWATTTGYTYNSVNQLYEIDKDKWVTAVGKVCIDQNLSDAFYETGINEKFSHFGYSTDLDGITRLTLYGRMLDGDIDEGLSMTPHYYSGVYKVDGQEYDGWAQLSHDGGLIKYATDESGNPIYILTERIVKDENSLINGDEEILIGKGVIYRMIDEWGNDCPYDFKNIKFTKPIISETDTPDSNLYYTFCHYDGNSSIIKDASIYVNDYNVYNNVIKPYYVNSKQSLNRILFIGNDCYWHSNTFGYDCLKNIFGDNCDSNTFGNGCYNNTFGTYCYSNTFGNGCYNNTFSTCWSNKFGNDCYSNTFGNNCANNTFGDYCQSNTFGNNCKYNTFGNDCYSNKFGNNCKSNTFGNNCYYNTFGNNCDSNTFGNYSRSNTFGDNCESNKFGNNCKSNTFGNNCISNTFGNWCGEFTLNNITYNGNYFYERCSYNLFGDYCGGNNFNVSCKSNTFGKYCYSNKFGEDCSTNTFGTNCENNTFGNYSRSNTFGTNCSNNTFGTNCNNNTFGAVCYGNKFGNSCQYNTFGNSCLANTFGAVLNGVKTIKSYYRNIIFDNGNSYIYLNCEESTSTTKYYQNVRIGLGVNGLNYKTINDSNVNQDYETLYRPTSSKTLTV